MSWECIIPEKVMEDVKSDKKTAKRVEQYLVSDKPLILMVEKDKNAQMLADMIMRRN